MTKPVPIPDWRDLSEEWSEEVLEYDVTPRPKSKFISVLDAKALFGANGGGHSRVVTSMRKTRADEPMMRISLFHRLADAELEETLDCTDAGGLRATHLHRKLRSKTGELCRDERVDFVDQPYAMPAAIYPEVMLPFILRSQLRSKSANAVYGWINDRFIARMYFELRERNPLRVPAGTFDADVMWLYPDLNDWINLGKLLTKLAKPFLPRYTIWYESDAPHRMLRFEGPYGPPGAPEVVMELRSPPR